MYMKKEGDSNVYVINWARSGEEDGRKGKKPFHDVFNVHFKTNEEDKKHKEYMDAYKQAAMLRLLNGNNDERK